jgi:hypothetical protein
MLLWRPWRVASCTLLAFDHRDVAAELQGEAGAEGKRFCNPARLSSGLPNANYACRSGCIFNSNSRSRRRREKRRRGNIEALEMLKAIFATYCSCPNNRQAGF